MRRALFCLLILLTAFRGMAGDAMAMEMARMHSSMDSVGQSSSVIAVGASAQPCHEAAEEDSAMAHPHSECTSCQVCHSPVLPRLPFAIAQAALPQFVSAQALPHWASADLARLQKPPVL